MFGAGDEEALMLQVKRESWGRGGGTGRRGRRGAGASAQAEKTAVARKQGYSLFLKQRAVLFSAKKWKQ